MDEFQEILQDFLVESFELVEKLDEDLVELETNPEDLELLNGIFRVAHTVKGASSFLNFDVLTHLTHHMEDVLNKARHGELILTPDIMDVVLESIDLMKELLYTIRDTSADAGIDVSECVAKLDKVSGGDGNVASPVAAPAEEPVAESTPVVEEEVEEELDYDSMDDNEIEAEIERLLKQRQAEDKAKREAKIAAGESVTEAPPAPSEESLEPEPEPTPAPVMAPPPPPPVQQSPAQKVERPKAAAPAKRTPAVVEQTIRVDVKRLDHLMNLIGELVLAKNRLIKINVDVEERYEGEEFLEELNQVVSIVSLVTTDLQIAVMKTRMLPIGKVFNKFPRMIRDLSRELSKNIELHISGEETELDKSIVEEIGDPLVHIIRNSCDHGVETPAIRQAQGKDEKGNIILKAYNEGNQIVIQIDDDGKGLDAQMLKNKSLEKGIITEKEADNMSDKEAYSLIFRPGFSTAAAVTSVSGRGVGMDVVKTRISKLNGVIDITSEIGVGTTLSIKVPLTLAIMPTLMVMLGDQIFAFPLVSVNEIFHLDLTKINVVDGQQTIMVRNKTLPLFYLRKWLTHTFNDIGEPEIEHVVIVNVGTQRVGFVVDQLIGQEEVVVKPLGALLQGTKRLAGATITGDGRISLILDFHFEQPLLFH